MSDHEREEEEQKVKVTDRRRFRMDDSGKIIERPDAPQRHSAKVADTGVPETSPPPEAQSQNQQSAPTQAGAMDAPQQPAQSQQEQSSKDDAPSQEEQMATQIFLEFLNSLAHSVLVHLGETPDPGSGLVRENLEAAQQTLEVLGVLRKKTNGNLNEQEIRMFDSLVYELMMRFRQKLEAKQNVPAPGGQNS